MMRTCLIVMAILLLLPAAAQANARLVSVTSLSGGCVSGPTGPAVQSWDVEPGETYLLQITDAWECTDGGNAATLNVRINSTNVGNTDLVASRVGAGVYEFEYTMPEEGSCTFPIFYCTTPGEADSGLFVVRDDGVEFQSHLRASTFEAGCTNPTEILYGDCAPIPGEASSWGTLKGRFH